MVKTEDVQKALATLKKEHKKKFAQTVELIVTLKDIDVKKTDQQLDFFTQLNHDRGKNIKICALVGPELIEDAKKVFDNTIAAGEFPEIGKDKKKLKELANDYDYFVAQANIMPQVAATFGRVLGPRGKMPNPKAGCVVPPKAQLQPVYDRLVKTVRIMAKTSPMVQVAVGKDTQEEKDVAENVHQLYDNIVQHLPLDTNNIKSAYIKLSMSPVIKVL